MKVGSISHGAPALLVYLHSSRALSFAYPYRLSSTNYQIMSFLSALQSKKGRLRPTTTTVTRPDGRKFEETPSALTEISSTGPGFVVDTKPDGVPAEISAGLFLGSQDCCDADVLRRHDIRSVLSVGVEAPTRCEGVDYKFVPCLDLPETDLLEDVLRECVDYIGECVGERRANVLVHCNAGVSRSASVVIGYLMLVRRCSYADAYAAVRSKRGCVRPNDGFARQLMSLEFGRGRL